MTTKKKRESLKWVLWPPVNSAGLDPATTSVVRAHKIGRLSVRCEVGKLKSAFVFKGRWKYAWDLEAITGWARVPRYVFHGDAPTLRAAKRCVSVALDAIRKMEASAIRANRRKNR